MLSSSDVHYPDTHVRRHEGTPPRPNLDIRPRTSSGLHRVRSEIDTIETHGHFEELPHTIGAVRYDFCLSGEECVRVAGRYGLLENSQDIAYSGRERDMVAIV